jgi:hypothetical protein
MLQFAAAAYLGVYGTFERRWFFVDENDTSIRSLWSVLYLKSQKNQFHNG